MLEGDGGRDRSPVLVGAPDGIGRIRRTSWLLPYPDRELCSGYNASDGPTRGVVWERYG